MADSHKSEIETGQVSGNSEYHPLDEEELKKVALGHLHGQLFGTWMLDEHDAHLIPSIFMVLMLMDDIARKELKRDGVVHLYEWMEKSAPRSINGYPMFMSCRMLNSDDAIRLQDKINQIKEALSQL